VPIILKSVSLKLLKPSGPVQACNGNALPYFFRLIYFLVRNSRNLGDLFVGGIGISSAEITIDARNCRILDALFQLVCKAFKNRRKNLRDVDADFMTVMKGKPTRLNVCSGTRAHRGYFCSCSAYRTRTLAFLHLYDNLRNRALLTF
jgi:hypothetical protein